jgi:hypothetical protein
VIEAIRSVAQGRSFLTRKVSRTLQEDYIRELEDRGLDDSDDLLTEREREILQLVVEGRTNKEVAALLNVSLTTVPSRHFSNNVSETLLPDRTGLMMPLRWRLRSRARRPLSPRAEDGDRTSSPETFLVFQTALLHRAQFSGHYFEGPLRVRGPGRSLRSRLVGGTACPTF